MGRIVAGVVLLGLLTMTGLQAQSPAPNLTPEQTKRQLAMALRFVQNAKIKPKVTCGTTIVPANPDIDRQHVKPAPDQATKFTLRQVPPGACR